MPDWPEHDSWAWETAGLTAGSTTGTTITASGTPNTKGSYTQLVASTTSDATGLMVSIFDNSARAYHLIDIAIGAAASEQVVVPDVIFQPAYISNAHLQHLFFPVPIPAGTRLSARLAANSASVTVSVAVHLVRGGWAGAGKSGGVVTAYGVDAANSRGTSIDSGAVAHTKGAWSQMTSSSTRPVRWLLLLLDNQQNNADTTSRFFYDIGIGAAASEQVVVPDIAFVKNNNTDNPGTVIYGPWPVNIPEGTRIAVRAQSSITDATDRLNDAVLYGVG